ncbi:F-box protein [Ceratobasidium sp. AG-Ba]|nr:F-box protein [Ceratobasidium sp. AG-Ba]
MPVSTLLPDEVLRQALAYLWPRDVSRFARTSRKSRIMADSALYKVNHIATMSHLISFCKALTTRPSAARALNMVSIDIREPVRFPITAVAAALLNSPNLTHLAIALPHPRDLAHTHHVDPSPLLYACGSALCSLTLTSHVPTAALSEFLLNHPNLVDLSLPHQSNESVFELPPEAVPHLTSVKAPPMLVACLVPNRPVTHVVISRALPRECMSAVVESLAASTGPVTSLSIEAEEVTLGVMQEVTVRLRELRNLGVKGRFLFGYSLSYSGLLLDIAPLLGRSPALVSVSLIGTPAVHSIPPPRSPMAFLSVSPSTPSASFTPSPSPPPAVDHITLEDELQVTRTFHTCAKQLREIVFPSGCRWVAKRDDDETGWEPARECRSARVWWMDRELELELAAAQQQASRIEQLETLEGRPSRRPRRSNKSDSNIQLSSSSSDSEEDLDFGELHPGDVSTWHPGKISLSSDDSVDELFESEQGGPMLVS